MIPAPRTGSPGWPGDKSVPAAAKPETGERIIQEAGSHRSAAGGETVVDVPAKRPARARVFSTGQGRKTDATDAHSIAVVATRTAALRPLARG